MKSVFKSVFVTIISFFLIVLICVFIGISSSSSEKEVVVKDKSILEINLNDKVVDRGSEFDFDFNSILDEENTFGLNTILKSIEKAKYDDRISGIYLNIEMPQTSSATTNEIRNKLQEFKDSTDKFIIAYSEVYSQKSYYLSSVADEIYLHPEGAIEFKGLSYEGMFFKGALEKLEVEPQIIRHGKFKSAIEPFILDKMSDENRLQVNRFLSSIWNNMKMGISRAKNISEDELNTLAENLSVQSPIDAVNFGLADALLFEDQVSDTIRKKIQIEKDAEINKISLREYSDVSVKTAKKKYSKDKIAVIYAQGGISSGEGDNLNIGSVTTSKAIKDAREDKKVKAIVLRVNSPGGSALASETILREMELAKESKPVVVSMGDVAASGGYYISCKADTIVANPTTITGSIGVFGMLPNLEKMMKNKLGITTDRVKTNAYSDLGSPFRALTTNERGIIQNQVERIYDTFITNVSEGRNMTKSAVDSIGQGRVWTGEDAKELGLIDVLGGLEDAINIAAEMAGLDNYRIKNLPKLKNPIEEILEDLGGQVTTRLVKNEIGESYQYYQQINNIMQMENVQMRMPMQFEIY
ncbi:MAG: signal peptide peptidase SppA [Flavobacteriales bacterium]|nr:signal peptide peptidase SppA [Flavobacteriales bacterium]MBL6873196.1 signal peptide peptidase SppA [Flavobacteriales bacterium]